MRGIRFVLGYWLLYMMINKNKLKHTAKVERRKGKDETAIFMLF
jgi:hypothetical protein